MKLSADELRRKIVASTFGFDTTADIEPIREPLAQERAISSIDFAIDLDAQGYNLYALGLPQTDKRRIAHKHLCEWARSQPSPADWCYLRNFADPSSPICLSLRSGAGSRFTQQVAELITNARSRIPDALTSEEFRARSKSLTDSFRATQSSDVAALETEARERGLAMLPTPNGFVFAPAKEGRVMEQEEFLALGESERETLQSAINEMTRKLVERLQHYPQKEQELIGEQTKLKRETASQVLKHLLARMRNEYRDEAIIIAFLAAVETTLADNVDVLVSARQSYGAYSPMATMTAGIGGMPANPERFFDQFKVNLLVDSSLCEGAPVVYETNPSLENLVGQLEHRVEFGTAVTDHNLVRAGALHRANGGVLLVDAQRLVQKPFAWEALKRALSDNCIRIETVGQLMSLSYSVSLTPQTIPLKLKVVLFGSRELYYLLRKYDTDFDELFKVVADFDDFLPWSDDNLREYAGAIASLVEELSLRHLNADAVGRVLEYCSRQAEDRERLTAHTAQVRDLLVEANYMARTQDSELISSQHVDQAIEKRIYRLDRFRERVQDNIARGLITVETSGSKVGQVNGLSVLQIGDTRFGQPVRITATARLGRGELIDIEREARLGGNIHSKAVMIVSAYLGQRYAKDLPFALHASLVFEQSYGGIEGDSASIAEVCALISAISERPIQQGIGITGSMDQLGNTQAIGGVNEKIEGFFDVCQEKGLTGNQGVLIPHANESHLMLRDDVVEAARAGRFHVYTMKNVDDAIRLLFAPEGETEVSPEEIDKAVDENLAKLREASKALANQANGVDGAKANG